MLVSVSVSVGDPPPRGGNTLKYVIYKIHGLMETLSPHLKASSHQMMVIWADEAHMTELRWNIDFCKSSCLHCTSCLYCVYNVRVSLGRTEVEGGHKHWKPSSGHSGLTDGENFETSLTLRFPFNAAVCSKLGYWAHGPLSQPASLMSDTDVWKPNKEDLPQQSVSRDVCPQTPARTDENPMQGDLKLFEDKIPIFNRHKLRLLTP